VLVIIWSPSPTPSQSPSSPSPSSPSPLSPSPSSPSPSSPSPSSPSARAHYPKAHAYTHNLWEASSGFCYKIQVGDLLSPRSNCLPFLQNIGLQLSTPWSWDIVRFNLGGRAKNEFQTMILTDVMIWAARHPLPAACQMPHATPHCQPHSTRLTPPGARRLQLNKSLDRACRSIFVRSRVFQGKLLADWKLCVCGSFG